MSLLKDIRRPPLALIKLVEAIGILLRVPKTSSKSEFKAPVPTNYDSTVRMLDSDFYGIMSQLAVLKSSGIPNDIATELYAKTQEPYFDYEAALVAGGLAVRELFNILMLILGQLQKDDYRIPIKNTNVYVVVDGTRSSYVAFDAATHVLSHGVCHVAALSSNDPYSDQTLLNEHLCADLKRRCCEQYKIPEHGFRVGTTKPTTIGELILSVEESMKEQCCNILVVGVDGKSSCGSMEFVSEFICWVAWDAKCTSVLAKTFSKVRPFPQSHLGRKFQVCVKEMDDLQTVFSATLEIMKPDDFLLLVAVVQSEEPVGVAQETRFDMGRRYDWASSSSELLSDNDKGPTRPGWNDNEVTALKKRMEELLLRSQSPGMVRIERRNPIKTIGQELVKVASAESVDFIVMRRGDRSHVSAECLQQAKCTVVFTM